MSTSVDDSVSRTLVLPTGPLLDHIPAVNYEDILQSRHRNPLLFDIIPNFETNFTGLLQQNCDSTEIVVGTDTELALLGCAGGRVADHLHDDHGLLGKGFQSGGWMTKTFEENLPDGLAELDSFAIVLPYWAVEFLFREIGPLVRAMESRLLLEWNLAANEEGLDILSVINHHPHQHEDIPLSHQAKHRQRGPSHQTFHTHDDEHL